MPATHVATATAIDATSVVVPATAAVGDIAILKVFVSRNTLSGVGQTPTTPARTWGSAGADTVLGDDGMAGTSQAAGSRTTTVFKTLAAGDIGAAVSITGGNPTSLSVSVYRGAGTPTAGAFQPGTGGTFVIANNFATTQFPEGALVEYIEQTTGKGISVGGGGASDPPGVQRGAGVTNTAAGGTSGLESGFIVWGVGDGYTMGAFTPAGRTLSMGGGGGGLGGGRIIQIPPSPAGGTPPLNAGSAGPAFGDRPQSAGISRRVRVPWARELPSGTRLADRQGGARRIIASGSVIGPASGIQRTVTGTYPFDVGSTPSDHAAAWLPDSAPDMTNGLGPLVVGAGRKSGQVNMLVTMAASLHMEYQAASPIAVNLMMGFAARGTAETSPPPAPTFFSIGKTAVNVDTCHRGMFGQRLFTAAPGSEVWFFPAFNYASGTGIVMFDLNDMMTWLAVEL